MYLLTIARRFLSYANRHAISFGIIFLSLITLQTTSWNLSSIVEVGGGGDHQRLKYVLFCIVLLLIFFLENNRQVYLLPLVKIIDTPKRKLIVFAIIFGVTVSTWIREIFPNSSKTFYNFFGVNQLEQKYADLEYFTKTTSCPGSYAVGDLIDCGGESVPYLYPSSLIRSTIGRIDFRSSLDLLQTLQLGIFLLAIITLLYGSSKLCFWLFLALVISPQMQLLLERGNLDLLILSLTLLACIFASDEKSMPNWVGFGCLLLGSVLKFYLLPSLLIFSWVAFRRLQRAIAICLSLLLTIVLLPEIYSSSLISITELKGTFGLRSLISFASGSTKVEQFYPEPLLILIASICLFVFSVGYKFGKVSFQHKFVGHPELAILTSVFLSIWLFTNSYHYKLVFLNIAFLFLTRDFHSHIGEPQTVALLVVLNFLSILAYRETFFLISNVVVTFSSGLLTSVLVKNLLRANTKG
jgi:hypothetical protein